MLGMLRRGMRGSGGGKPDAIVLWGWVEKKRRRR